MTFDRVWTDEMVEELPRLIERALTPKQIRIALYDSFGVEVTRNALAGKMYRLGLKCIDARTGAVRAGRPNLAVKERHAVAPPWGGVQVVTTQPDDESDSYAKYHWTCRYPMNDDMKHPEWCGAERRKNSPYCPAHHALCHKAADQEEKPDAE